MKVLLAFDSFKDALSAVDACDCAARALKVAQPAWKLDKAPLSDGGEGFCEILTTSAKGEYYSEYVLNPILEPHTAAFSIIKGTQLPPFVSQFVNKPVINKVAVIEMAQAAGLQLLSPEDRTPWATSTYGVGMMIRDALEHKPDLIILGVGGSATNDAGLGALEALGLHIYDEEGEPIQFITPREWGSKMTFSGELPKNLPPILIASDVTNPLLGPEGATAVYAPQKGLLPKDFEKMESLMKSMAKGLCKHFKKNESLMKQAGTGAGGGLPFGLMAACNASIVPGYELVSEWVGLRQKLQEADIVITGEGSFDKTSLHGKGTGRLIHEALQLNKKVYVFAGKLEGNIPMDNLKTLCIAKNGVEIQYSIDNCSSLLFDKLLAVFS